MNSSSDKVISSTRNSSYAMRLSKLESVAWKRWIRPIDPFMWHLRSLRLGQTLEVGCGLGRNLKALEKGSVGIDHNEACVQHCLEKGFRALTPQEFASSDFLVSSFDTLLLAHVVEHMTLAQAKDLVKKYGVYVKDGGRLLLITPQEKGQKSDPTHVEFMTPDKLSSIARDAGFLPTTSYSFPLPKLFGQHFIYNEFVLMSKKAF